jgi:hypothetical protein
MFNTSKIDILYLQILQLLQVFSIILKRRNNTNTIQIVSLYQIKID